MATIIVISIFAGWAVLSVIGGEFQRQRQNAELLAQSKRKAQRESERATALTPAATPASASAPKPKRA